MDRRTGANVTHGEQVCSFGTTCCGECDNRYCCNSVLDKLDQTTCYNNLLEQHADQQQHEERTFCEAYYDKQDQYWPRYWCTQKGQLCTGSCSNRVCERFWPELNQTECEILARTNKKSSSTVLSPSGSLSSYSCDAFTDSRNASFDSKICADSEQCCGSCDNCYCCSDSTKMLNRSTCLLRRTTTAINFSPPLKDLTTIKEEKDALNDSFVKITIEINGDDKLNRYALENQHLLANKCQHFFCQFDFSMFLFFILMLYLALGITASLTMFSMRFRPKSPINPEMENGKHILIRF